MDKNQAFIDGEAKKHWVIRKAVLGDFSAVSALEELEFDIHRHSRPDYFKLLESSYTKAEF